MKLKFITKLLISSVLASSLNISSFASSWSEDGRYETFEGENITIDNVLEEDAVDVEIEGNTLVNLSPWSFPASVWAGSGAIYWRHLDYRQLNLVEGKTYTIVVSGNIDNLSYVRIGHANGLAPNQVSVGAEDLGKPISFIANGIQGNYFTAILHKTSDLEWTQSELDSFKIMLLEGDWTNKEIPEYFEGLKSVGQDGVNGHNIEVVSQNKNLFDIDRFVSEYSKIDSNIKKIDEKTVQVIGNTNVNNYKYMLGEFKENTSYTISYNRPIKNFIKAVYTDGSSTQSYTVGLAKFTTDPLKTVSYIKITYQNSGYVNNFSDVQIEEGSVATEYTPYKSNRVQIPLSEPLRSLPNGIKDKIVKKDGKWVVERNCGEVLLNGSENWGTSNLFNSDDYMFFSSNSLKYNNNGRYNHISDSYLENVYGLNSDDKAYKDTLFLEPNNSKTVNITISKTRLLSASVEGFKNYLSENNIKLVYQLYEPIYESLNIDSTVNLYLDITHISNNSNIPANMKVAVDRVANRAKEAIERAKNNTTIDNISQARYWSNLMKESILKDSFQDETDNITNVQDLTIERKTESVNTDIYIKMKNIVSLSLDTNSIVFEDVDSTEDTELRNAVNLTVNSSLPYRVNAYLEGDIYNKDKTTTLDKTMLNIKANKDIEYKVFSDALTPIVIFDNQEAGEDNTHGVDLKLASSSAKKADIYKTSIKFEVVQK